MRTIRSHSGLRVDPRLHAVLQARARQLRTHIVFSGFIAMVVTSYTGLRVAWIWFATTASLRCLEALLLARRPVPAIAAHLSIWINVCAFCALSWIMAWFGGGLGVGSAAFLLCACVLNNIANARISAAALCSAVSPILIYVAGLPALELARNQPVESVVPFAVSAAILLLFSAEIARGTYEAGRAQEAARARTEHLATHDMLTGLANRQLFHERLATAFEQWRTGGPRFAVYYLDLDHFKAVNDSLGHAAGDAVLIEVAHRVGRELPGGSLFARLGGDEFALLVRAGDLVGRAENLAATDALALRIIQVIEQPFVLPEGPTRIGISIGYAECDADADIKAILRCADLALYRAKSSGRNTVRRFEPPKSEPRKSEPPKSEPPKSEPPKSEPRKSEPRKSELCPTACPPGATLPSPALERSVRTS